MLRSLEIGLVFKYSSLFGGQGRAEESFTFECMNGWFHLVMATLQLLERYAELERLKVEVVEVKEKFGLLRIHHRGGDKVVDQLLDISELVSGYVCEVCGAQGSLSEYQGWLRARCFIHGETNDAASVFSCRISYVESYVKCVALLIWFFKDSAVSWVNQECLGLGSRRPCELLASNEGCYEIYMLIRRLQNGVGI